MEKEELPLAPVTGWELAPISAYGVVMCRLSYLTHQTQRVEDAHQSPRYALTLQQARELIEALQKQVRYLESGPQEGTGMPKH
ncbi:hypothetical protein [uncultured Ramlibacter sp.]|uniref:hypothetical protein n=1 Tax=uncultured Ramlibacter sp. TaxID=260755 RepID=UPI002617DBEE|nr:hypothetical protein [uncultured Ramlibacter sp.]